MNNLKLTEREVKRLEEAYEWSQKNSTDNDLKWVNFVNRVNWYDSEENLIILDRWYTERKKIKN